MSNLDSWEDSPDAQDEQLSQQTQGMHLQNPNVRAQANTFQPGAQSFQPGAQTFQPGQQWGQYGGYDPNQQYNQYYQQQQQYGGYQQYGGGQGFQQYNQGYGQQYPQYNQQQSYIPPHQRQQQQQQPPQQQQQRQQQQSQPPIQIAKRPTADSTASASAAPAAAALKPVAAKDKPATASGPAPKMETTGGTKVMSIGGAPAKPSAPAAAAAPPATASPATKVDKSEPEAGAKAVAAKKIEKTGETTSTASGATSPTQSSGRNSPTPATDRRPMKDAAKVAEEQEEQIDQETLREMYGKEHVNVIFLGHVDAGKSTLGGSILYVTGMVDERTMDKYKREAKEAGRETWYLSWALDLTKEERSKGKTVEVGRGFFETDKRRYSILDAPGHKTYVPNMVSGASQADVGILVISARKGEYETGFEKGGQTREHAMLAKTQGVNKLIIAVNKMDDPTVEWSQERYDECLKKLMVFLKGLGYNPKTDIFPMPIAAQQTQGIKDRIPKDVCPWYSGPSLLEYLDDMQTLERKVNAPFMMPVAAKYRDLGTMIEGKIEAGVIKKENKYLLMPSRQQVSISSLYGETEDEVSSALCGDQIRLRIRGAEEEDIFPGFVLCQPSRPVHCVSAFEAQIQLLELKSILSAGFNCVLHVHSATEEVTFAALLHKLEKGTGRKSKKAPGFATKGMQIIARLEVIGGAGSVCVERFEDYPQLGRFTLRDQGQTIAIGKVTKLITDVNGA